MLLRSHIVVPLAAVLVAAAATIGVATAAAHDIVFTGPNGHYSVHMPIQPRVETKTEGGVSYTNAWAMTEDGGIVSVVDRPLKPGEQFNGGNVISALQHSATGPMTRNDRDRFRGLPAQTAAFPIYGGQRERVLVFRTPRDGFIITVSAPSYSDVDVLYTAFTNSFRLT